MQKRKGFTLVELVIVIAVIAILAGVLIGTFASVLSKANESARMQEMKAAEHDQKASDILNKLNNAEWFGWEDLETKIGESVQTSVKGAMETYGTKPEELSKALQTAVTSSVEAAIAKYASSQGQENTQLTAEQVKYIVEQAVGKSGGVTETQVKAIVQSALQGVSTLSAAQVQRIVDTATTKVTQSGLTAADLAKALAGVATTADLKFDDVIVAVNNATKGVSTLTAEEIQTIVAKYVYSNGSAKGNYTWYDAQATDMKIDTSNNEKAADSLVALATLTTGGETFEGKTISLGEKDAVTPATITLSTEEDWNPIKSFKGTLEGNGTTVSGVKFDIIYFSTEEVQSTGTASYTGYNTLGDFYGNKTAFGFINELSEDAVIRNLKVTYSMTEADWGDDPMCKYTYFGGIVGIAKPGSTIENCEVSGTIYSWGRVGGIVGGVLNCTKVVNINNCSFTGQIHAKVSVHADTNMDYVNAGGIVGYVDGPNAANSGVTGGAVKLTKCVVKNASLNTYNNAGVNITTTCNGVGSMIGYVVLSYIDATHPNQLFSGGDNDDATSVTAKRSSGIDAAYINARPASAE